jgi:1,4-alpha-glucan branching enzyme
MPIGTFCLVLHGHLPYVLRHGVWPHGEDWLYEAAAETYLPLLATIDECEYLNGRPRVTLGLTPVLLEQLAHEDFKKGFERYLQDRIERARADRSDFQKAGEAHLAYLAAWWEEGYGRLQRQFADLGRDLPRAFAQRAAAGLVEVLTSSATHAYLPLLAEDSSVRAQVRAGLASSQRVLGRRPSGLWLPECAYRPAGAWSPPVPWGPTRDRPGLERIVAEEGVGHFFVEHRLLEASRSEWARRADAWEKVSWDEAAARPERGWRSVHEPVWAWSDGRCEPRVAAIARDMKICEQVWSGAIGYPADGAYLEFHKRRGERRGLRYWKVTSKDLDLGRKDPYQPDDVAGRVFAQGQHFADLVRQRLRRHHQATGRPGVVAACFDAELFGHWWFEGPRFLRDALLTLNADPEVEVATAGEFLRAHPPDKIAWLPEGSWGDGGDHRVWANDRVNWMWQIEYRCEAALGRLTFHLPWRARRPVRRLLEKAGRELLLLQASDWPFAISRGQAVDYGTKRFMQHVARFECLADLAEKLAADSAYLGKLAEVERLEVRDADVHDVIFPEIDLNWWNV